MRHVARLMILSALLFATACGTDPTSTDFDAASTQAGGFDRIGRERGAFFPLAIGNEWHYEVVQKHEVIGGMPQPPWYSTLSLHLSVVGTETISGREYYGVEWRLEEPGEAPVTVWVRFRQDGAGLYEADVPVTEPPAGAAVGPSHFQEGTGAARAIASRLLGGGRLDAATKKRSGDGLARGPRGGVMSGEITRLAYPLHPGQVWSIRDEPLYESRVEGREPMGGQSPWRISVWNELLGPNDVVIDWYGRQGIIAEYQRIESPYLGPGGAEIGLQIDEIHIWLSTLREGPSTRGGFFPLADGNWWTYEGSFQAVVIPYDGPPEPPIMIEKKEARRIDGTAMFEGREYVVEHQQIDESDSGLFDSWVLYRQDHSGLYEADATFIFPPTAGATVRSREPRRWEARWDRIAATIPAAHRAAYRRAWMELGARYERIMNELRAKHVRTDTRATLSPGGGVQSREITRLAYPLHPGQEWIIRDDPQFSSVVEGRELRGAGVPAWRIRGESELFGPADVVHLFYGRDGYAGWQLHLEAVATDVSGNPVGVIVSDDVMELVDFEIQRR